MLEHVKKVQSHYDRVYTEHDKVFGRGNPETKIVKRIPEYIKTGVVLDIGAGQGRNSLFLAERGFAVTAVDISSVGLAQIAESAKSHGLQIDTLLASAGDDDLPVEDANVVIFSFILHHIEDTKARNRE